MGTKDQGQQDFSSEDFQVKMVQERVLQVIKILREKDL